MNDVISLSLDNADRLYSPPLVDHVACESLAYAVSFVPSDDVSEEEKCFVTVSKGSADGRRIAVLLTRICDLCEIGDIDRLIHGGGGDYTLAANARSIQIQDLPNDAAVEVADRIHQIAEAAQYVFILENRARSRSA